MREAPGNPRVEFVHPRGEEPSFATHRVVRADAVRSAPLAGRTCNPRADCSLHNHQRICDARKNSHDRTVTEFRAGLDLVITAFEQIRDAADRPPRAWVCSLPLLDRSA